MYQAPDLPAPPVEMVFPEEAKGLWLRALARPEADMQARAAEAIARATWRGVKGFEAAVPPLTALVDRADVAPEVRLAAAQALVTLEARDAAPILLRQAQTGASELRERIEPALARWNYAAAHAMWLDRLREPQTPQRTLVLAIQSLAAVHELQAADRLRELVLAEHLPVPVRLEAAHALAALRTKGLEPDAERLAADPSPKGTVARVAAAALLQQHGSPTAVKLLQSLVRDREPAVAALAVARLIDIDPDLVVPALQDVVGSPDPNVRTLGVEVLRQRPSEEHIRLLADRLDDLHPDVRIKARRALQELAAKKELRERVLREGTRVLAAKQWQGLEQAAILLTQLDHKPAAGHFVELLEFDRPEVFVTVAWGLRRLAVPETLPAALNYSQAELERQLKQAELPQRKGLRLEYFDNQLSQLNQFLGQQNHVRADTVLRQFVPKRPGIVGPESRAAAIWALGLFHKGKTVPELVPPLQERLNDSSSIPPEDIRVRRMCAITLGRIQGKEALDSLRKWFWAREPAEDPINNACGWAIERLTGEAVPPPKTLRKVQQDWFLMPRP
jgi:HEAT repeat protein